MLNEPRRCIEAKLEAVQFTDVVDEWEANELSTPGWLYGLTLVRCDR